MFGRRIKKIDGFAVGTYKGLPVYRVQSLQDIKIRRNQIEVLVSWENFDQSQSSWEPLKNLGEGVDELLTDLRKKIATSKKIIEVDLTKIDLINKALRTKMVEEREIQLSNFGNHLKRKDSDDEYYFGGKIEDEESDGQEMSEESVSDGKYSLVSSQHSNAGATKKEETSGPSFEIDLVSDSDEENGSGDEVKMVSESEGSSYDADEDTFDDKLRSK